jgi:glycosyltransferase involved in cell wall biosynthesis
MERRDLPKISTQEGSGPGVLMTGAPLGTGPRVSIIIPYYNQPAFLAEAVLSAKQQTYPSVEIIIVDDGSTVPARSILAHVSDVLILRTENRGVAAARNLGFHHSSGDYLIFLDSDDRLLPGAVNAHLKALREQPEAGLSFGSVRIIDQQGTELQPAHVCRPRKDYSNMFLEGNPIGCPGAAMLRREAFVAVGLFEESRIIAGSEDYHLYLRVVRRAPLVRHTVCAVEYRKHGNNASQARERMLMSTMAVLDQIEPILTDSERRRLPHARRRWQHVFRRNSTFAYRVKDMYYSFRAMLEVPLISYFGRERQ